MAAKQEKECQGNNIAELTHLAEPAEVHIGSGAVLKRLIRKLTYWLYRPMFDRQVEYNKQLIRILDDLSQRAEDLSKRIDALSRTQESIVKNIGNLNRDRQDLVDAFGTAEVADAVKLIVEYMKTQDCISENIGNLNRDRQDFVDAFGTAEVADAVMRIAQYMQTQDCISENIGNLNRDRQDFVDAFGTAEVADAVMRIAQYMQTQDCIAENISNLNRDRQDFVNALGAPEVADAVKRLTEYMSTQDCIAENVRNLNRDVGELRSVKCYLPKNEKPRVIQLVSCLNFGDAVGNEVVAFKKFLRENGYVTEIFTEAMSNRLPADTAVNFRRMPVLDEDDIVIYHFASQCTLFDTVKQLGCKVVLRYHNVTPPEFFEGYDENAVRACANGLSQAAELKDYVDYCLPVSEYNKEDLINMGYTCPMTVIPILIRFSDYEQTPDSGVIERYRDGRTNVLFVGRMAPNKKVEDVITAFAIYKEKYDREARLFLVGSYGEGDGYYRSLRKHILDLGVQDVIFPGHISFAEILAYYSVADVFLCMSEHEGFCVPLVEAMYFHVPIVAYSSSAIPSTLGGSGVLIGKKDFDAFADAIKDITCSKNRAKIIIAQNKRLEELSQKRITAQLKAFIESIL